MFSPRPKQRAVLEYGGGKMGVSAVPGSGKTATLSCLAAKLVASGELDDDQEILVVTLVNSAVDNFGSRVAAFVEERGLLPHVGYRVCTLHSLANEIVRGRPDLLRLGDTFQILDERATARILQNAAQAWLRGHPYAADGLLSPDLDDHRAEWVRQNQWPVLVSGMASTFVRQAKDLLASPEQIRDLVSQHSQHLPLVDMCCSIYSDYQNALSYRGAVDFDDLISMALRVLQLDAAYLAQLRHRWTYVLEDEAQDSSRLQERILRLLTGEIGNWVRVGDPNQAIYETFTTADPTLLLSYLKEAGVVAKTLPNSGRSTLTIIGLANRLVDWTTSEHPVTPVRSALTLPRIEPTPPGDPQPNPEDESGTVALVADRFTPAEEVQYVVQSLRDWLASGGKGTAAVLVPRNDRGLEVAAALRRHAVPCFEMLRSTQSTRKTAGCLANVIKYLSMPTAGQQLATVYQVWLRPLRDNPDAWTEVQETAKTLRRCEHVEEYVWPRLGQDWLDKSLEERLPQGELDRLATFRQLVRRWQEAALLPIDQLVLTLSQDLFTEPDELALAHKLALLLRSSSEQHPEWQLPELTEELAVIARNERRFLGLGRDDTGFDPSQYEGTVIVTTLHKAKGLEWDRVYLMAVNNYSFPSALSHDVFISEKWFVRDHLNLEAEALARLEALLSGQSIPPEGQATACARQEYARERVRLLYVGITRARRDLIMTWNTGRRNNLQQAVPFIALQDHTEGQSDDVAS
jgi:DNA helicase-2/ATP-dependent DNA helicase PcrA